MYVEAKSCALLRINKKTSSGQINWSESLRRWLFCVFRFEIDRWIEHRLRSGSASLHRKGRANWNVENYVCKIIRFQHSVTDLRVRAHKVFSIMRKSTTFPHGNSHMPKVSIETSVWQFTGNQHFYLSIWCVGADNYRESERGKLIAID